VFPLASGLSARGFQETCTHIHHSYPLSAKADAVKRGLPISALSLVAQRQAGNLKRKDFWKIVLKGSPDWIRYLVYGFLGYAVVNFMIFFQAQPGPMVVPTLRLWSGADFLGIGWCSILRRSPFYIQQHAKTAKECAV